MSSEVEFGELREPTLQTRRRPDQNGQWAVVACGQTPTGQLPIYVDLDTMLDIQEHAHSDTRVELGGVMLGHTGQDDQGRPFVVVLDSLRAEHYKATRGSFTFTHETWQAITRQRTQRDPELQMVGWYHTHPGWGVFLSGMDQFICQNFFAHALDVALVVDPCQGDTGWFQWNENRQTERCSGYYLFSSRHRQWELESFVEQQLSEPMSSESSTIRRSINSSSRAPVVQIVERTSQVHWFAWSLLAMQLILMSWLIYSQASGSFSSVAANGDVSERMVSQAQWEQAHQQQIASLARVEAFRELAQWLAAERGGEIQWIDVMAEAQLQRKQFESSNRSLSVRVDQLERELAATTERLAIETEKLADLKSLPAPGTSNPGGPSLTGANQVSADTNEPTGNTPVVPAWLAWVSRIPAWAQLVLLVVGLLLAVSGAVLWGLAYRNGWLHAQHSHPRPFAPNTALDEELDGIS